MAGTVYILGAGASRAATASEKIPTPLARDFFKKTYLDEHWYDVEYGCPFKNSPLFFILSRYFASESSDRDVQGIEDINIEEVYSFLYSYDRVFQSSSYRRADFETARKQLHDYIIKVIRYTSWKKKKLGFLGRIASKLDETDSIITFNWDTLIEQALSRSKKKACKALLAQQLNLEKINHVSKISTEDDRVTHLHQGRLIKVHGSISYSCCTNLDCRRNKLPFVWELSVESPEYWACTECGSPTEVMILPPHGAKTYSANPFFKLQASLAAQKLSLAEKIVLIGYSVPIFDIEARSMLRCARIEDDYDSEAWLQEVNVVDPQTKKPRYISEIRNLLGVDNYHAHGHKVAFRTFTDILHYERAK